MLRANSQFPIQGKRLHHGWQLLRVSVDPSTEIRKIILQNQNNINYSFIDDL